jgi:hypothetical protein
MAAKDRQRTSPAALSSSRWHVAKDIVAIADEDNAVPSRIASVPFDPGIGNCKVPAVLDVMATKGYVVALIGDDGDILTALNLITVGPIGVRQSTAAQVRLVWPHQFIEPLAMQRIDTIPSDVVCRSLADGKDKDGCAKDPDQNG